MRFSVTLSISFPLFLQKRNPMIANINPISLIVISLSLASVSCKNDIGLKEVGQTTNQSTNYDQQILPEHNNSIIDSLFEFEIDKEMFKKTEHNYHVHGTDEDGNKVFGTITIDGKLGLGMIRGNEAKGIEIIAERNGPNVIIATDVKGYEYQLKLDHD